MDLGQIPLFAMLRGRLGYLTERQRVIAENVANADTPGYLPRDLKPFSFQAQVEAAAHITGMAVSQPGHMQPKHSAKPETSIKTTAAEVSETTLDGNAVSLEEEMMKMSEARMSYDAAIGFYQKSLNLLRLAGKRPGA